MRGGIDRFASKGDNKDDADLCDDHNFDVEGKEGTEWETTKGMKKTTKRTRRRRRRKKRRGGGGAADDNAKEDELKKEENLSSQAKCINSLNTQTKQIEKEILSENTW